MQPTIPRPERGGVLIACIALALALFGASGCNIVGPAYILVHGPEKTRAVYSLDPERPTVVFIDDRSSVVPRRSLRMLMAGEIERNVLGEKLVKDMISAQSALAASAAERDGKPMPITEIGRAVRAEVVIYVAVDMFTLSVDGAGFDPTAAMRVKIIDAVNDKRLWPEDRAGYSVVARLDPKQGGGPSNTTERARVEDELAVHAGLTVARLFFKHESPKGVKVPK